MELVQDTPAENSNAPAKPVTALEALKSLWPAIVAQIEGEMKASRFESLNEMKAALEALDALKMSAQALCGMAEAHAKKAAAQEEAYKKSLEVVSKEPESKG